MKKIKRMIFCLLFFNLNQLDCFFQRSKKITGLAVSSIQFALSKKVDQRPKEKSVWLEIYHKINGLPLVDDNLQKFKKYYRKK